MHSHLFSDDIIDKLTFEKSVLNGIGRDLQLPQSVALQQCRQYTAKLYQMWSDGFSVQFTLENLSDWIQESAKSDDDLFWHLHKRSPDAQDMLTA
ncbi:hypothetical protein A9Q99_06965 [Gammaproteobacteria bacterium 45_16_T64]|nr:hypothetical protein A9Q99_06965 [Gammaproteobacteria bacterium 45_16_T64]